MTRLGLFLALASYAPLARAAAPAELTEVVGKVDVAPPGTSDFAAARPGQHIAESSRVRTGRESAATLVMASGSTVKLQERSSMLVTAVKAKNERSAIVLFFGRLWSKVAKTDTTSFEVYSPNAVAGVRGTEFTTAVGEDGNARVQVKEGKVAVSNDAEEVAVGAGQAADAGADDVSAPEKKSEPDWQKWQKERRDYLQKNGEAVAKGMKGRIDKRRDEIKRLSEAQRQLRAEYAEAAPAEQAEIKAKLAKNAERLSALGARAEGQFGAFEHWGELAEDPDFGAKFYGAGFVRSEIKRMRALKADLDKMIAEGTDMSLKGMEKMMDDMGRKGKRGTIKDKKGSTKDELFEDEQ